MKRKLTLILFALALLLTVSVAPVYAGDEDGSDCIYGVGDSACSSGGDTDGGQIWSG